MSYHKNDDHSKDKNKEPKKDSEKNQADTRLTKRSSALYSEYLNTLRYDY